MQRRITALQLSRLCGIAFILLLAGRNTALLRAQDVTVKVYFDRSILIVNQSATLNVELSGSGINNASNPELPDFGVWFKLLRSSGTSQNFQWINGQFSGSITHTYSVMPLKTGTAPIPEITVKVGGKTYSSQPFTVEIKDAGAVPPQQQSAQQQQGAAQQEKSGGYDILLVPTLNKHTVYQNEGVTLEYKVYIAPEVTVSGYSALNTPNFQGFWKMEYSIPPTPRLYPEMYRDKQYNAAVLKRIELYPTQSGELNINPMEMEFTVRTQRSRSTGNIFDRFFNDPFFSEFGGSESVAVRSSPLKITVKPLPAEGKPPEFNGAVGKFSITAIADKTTCAENESITLTVTIEGTGNIKLLNEPVLKLPDSFERYDPKIDDSINLQENTINGKKTFEYVLVPRKKGDYTIEPITFAYFDPGTARYVSLKTQPIPVTVTPGTFITENIPRRGITREEVRLMGSDIRFIKESAVRWTKTGDRGFFSGLFLSVLFVPVIIVCCAFAYSRRLYKLNTNIGLKRSRQANAIATKRLKKASGYLNAGDADAFYPEIARALQEYIADKLNVAAAGILTEELEQKLLALNIDSDLVEAYTACLKKCDFHRFSSVKSTQAEINKLYEDSRTAIYEMEQRLKKAA